MQWSTNTSEDLENFKWRYLFSIIESGQMLAGPSGRGRPGVFKRRKITKPAGVSAVTRSFSEHCWAECLKAIIKKTRVECSVQYSLLIDYLMADFKDSQIWQLGSEIESISLLCLNAHCCVKFLCTDLRLGLLRLSTMKKCPYMLRSDHRGLRNS